MAVNLSCEFSKFSRNSKHLKRLLRETKQSVGEIERSGFFDNNHLNKIKLPPEEMKGIENVVEQPLGLIILGQSCLAKASVVNELFGQPLLPTLYPRQCTQEECVTWRMVRFSYGIHTQISLALPNSYELVEHLVEQPWHTIPAADLEVGKNPDLSTAVLEIRLHHALLHDNVQVVVSPSNHTSQFSQVFSQCVEGLTTILIYCFKDSKLTEKELEDLMHLKKVAPKQPIFFVCSRPVPTCELTESEQHARKDFVSSCSHFLHDLSSNKLYRIARTQQELESRLSNKGRSVFQQLCGLGYLSSMSVSSKRNLQRQLSNFYEVESELIENFENFPSIFLFIRHVLHSLLVKATTLLNESHNRCLRMFVLTAFDMTRDMMMTPKRLEYTRRREAELYSSLMTIASKKQEEIRQLIVNTIEGIRDDLLEEAANHQFQGLADHKGNLSVRELQICTAEIQNLVLGRLNSSVAGKLIGSVDCLRENFVGTLERCLKSLEANCEEGESVQASSNLRQILNAAYEVELTVKTSASILWALFEKMKQLIQSLLWKTPSNIDIDWKRKVASDMLASLSATRLARSICAQFRDRLKTSHEQFTASLRQLESMHSGRLQRTEEQRIKVKKMYAPKIARYALESTSLRDLVLFGVPKLGRELGRGQYGVVYACDSWGGFTPCAMKSVVPPDERHWNDLAMEFFYTRSTAEHERVVQIRGSVIDYSYGGGSTPAVLFIMERLHRDLYSAIKAGIDFSTRLQIALDVIQGIRFLHNQGLVHRDIKLKNVLLDKKNRAKITDLGFCKPEAMMSGSIVGTPIHMAPELLNGRYDNSVDVYAFGILLWYLCAGQVKLPYVFEQCITKDQLWNCVRKGARPERLPQFDEECWKLMEECWATDPLKRPLLGDVEAQLMKIMEHYCSISTTNGCQDGRRRSHSYRRRHAVRNYHSKNQKSPVSTQHIILDT